MCWKDFGQSKTERACVNLFTGGCVGDALVVSLSGVDGEVGLGGSVKGPVLSAKQILDGVVCFFWDTVSSSDGDIINTERKDWAIRLKLEDCLFDCLYGS